MSSEYSSFASLPASFFLAAASMSGMAHKRKGWLEASKIFLFIGFPVAFTYLQAQPEIMGFVVKNRQYVRYPGESKMEDVDTAKILATRDILREMKAEQEVELAKQPKSGGADAMPELSSRVLKNGGH